MSGVAVYAQGVVSLSACVPAALPAEEVTAEVNVLVPTGISSGWSLSSDPEFATGQPNPCPCDRDPSRVHRLYQC